MTKSELKERLKTNNNLQIIADEYGVSVATVSNLVKRYNLRDLARDYNNQIDEKTVIELYCSKDLCMAEISRELGCSVSPIRRILKSKGINIEPTKKVQKKSRFKLMQHKKHSGENNPFYGKSHTKEVKTKMRKSAIKRLKNRKGQINPNYNSNACKIIEEYGMKFGCKFKHAENGGEYFINELGYWVDGYNKENNIVIEVYESYHYQGGSLREKDKQREEEIKDFLDCRFI